MSIFIHCDDCVGTGRAPCYMCGGTAYDNELAKPCAFCYDGTEACDKCEGTGGYESERPFRDEEEELYG